MFPSYVFQNPQISQPSPNLPPKRRLHPWQLLLLPWPVMENIVRGDDDSSLPKRLHPWQLLLLPWPVMKNSTQPCTAAVSGGRRFLSALATPSMATPSPSMTGDAEQSTRTSMVVIEEETEIEDQRYWFASTFNAL